MKSRTVLCPIDFSEFGQFVNEYATALAGVGGKVIYLNVDQPDVSFGGMAYFDEDAETAKRLAAMGEYVPLDSGVEYEHIVKWGDAAEVIVDYAEKHDIDLIVIGTHGRSGLLRVVMGSVAEHVVRHAPCPVLAVKRPKTD